VSPDRLRREPLPTSAPPRRSANSCCSKAGLHGRLKPLLGTLREGAKTWHDPVTEDPLLGAVEAVGCLHTTADAHPSTCTVHFRVVGHRCFEGEPNESGVL
jgi:spore coat protein A